VNRRSYRFTDGSIYNGQWKEKKMHGLGVLSYANGVKYEGEFYENTFQGQGIIEYPDGTKYEGHFIAGKRHGHGTIYHLNGNFIQGNWIDGKKNGRFVFIKPDGSKHETLWVDDEKQDNKAKSNVMIKEGLFNDIDQAEYSKAINLQTGGTSVAPTINQDTTALKHSKELTVDYSTGAIYGFGKKIYCTEGNKIMKCKCGKKINRSKYGIMYRTCARCREEKARKLRQAQAITPIKFPKDTTRKSVWYAPRKVSA